MTYRFPDLTRRLLLISHSEQTVSDIEGIVDVQQARAWDEGFATAVKWNGAAMCENPYRERDAS